MRSPKRIAHPFPYQGSKRRLAPFIVELVPQGSTRFIEPFAGSAALTIAVATSDLASHFWINDIHTPLVSLWREILEEPDRLCDSYRSLWEDQIGRDRLFYDEVRDRFNRTHQPADFLYLLARCVKAAIRYNSRGEFNNSPDKRRLGMKPDAMAANIKAVAGLLRDRTTVSCGSYLDVIRGAGREDVVYMDPPYQGVCDTHNHRYLAGIEYDEFVDSLNLLNSRGVSFIVSYDGRTGSKSHGRVLPKHLQLTHHEVLAGRSTQATLLGRSEDTYESVYVSPALESRLNNRTHQSRMRGQKTLFQD